MPQSQDDSTDPPGPMAGVLIGAMGATMGMGAMGAMADVFGAKVVAPESCLHMGLVTCVKDIKKYIKFGQTWSNKYIRKYIKSVIVQLLGDWPWMLLFVFVLVLPASV